MNRKATDYLIAIVIIISLFMGQAAPLAALGAPQNETPLAAGGITLTTALTGRDLLVEPDWSMGARMAAATIDTDTRRAALTAPSTEVAAVLASAKQVAAGGSHTCALTDAGGVKCWGWNLYGQLGDGTTINRFAPVDVVGLSSGVKTISAGFKHTCVLMQDGSIKCWGINPTGQLGNETTIDSPIPVDVIGISRAIAITTGYYHSCALMEDGGVKCWGTNIWGELGDGTTVSSSIPMDVINIDDVIAISSGGYTTCALTSVGGAKCWGLNYSGQLGDGTTSNRTTPVDVIGINNGIKDISVGSYHACALTTDGGVKCWGMNYSGQLGDGTTSHSTTPVNVVGLDSGAVSISAGGSSIQWVHTCAQMENGSVKCWGNNNFGQFGNGTTTSSTVPIAVINPNDNISTISTGGEHTCGLIENNGIKCWGRNFAGALGIGTTNDSATPVDVVGFGPTTLSVLPPAVAADSASASEVTLVGVFPGHRVRFASSLPGSWFEPVAGVVGGDGRLITALRSSEPGQAVITVLDETTGMPLSASATVTFTAYTPPDSDFLDRINNLVDTGVRSLNQIKDDAAAVADDGDFFRGAIGANAAALSTDVVFNMADVIGGVNQTPQLQKAVRLACPGCYVPGTWNVRFSENYPAASRLLDIGSYHIGFDATSPSRLAEFIGWGGAKYFAASYLNSRIDKIPKDVAKEVVRTIFANANDGMTDIAYPTIRDTADNLANLLQTQSDDLLNNLPSLSSAQQRAYEDDLTGRTLALITLGRQLADERQTLADFRQMQGHSSNAFLNFVLRFAAKELASATFDGPGKVAVGGTLLLFDGYMDGKKLDESMQMYDLATGTLLGAPDALRQTYQTAYRGLDRIARVLPAHRARGVINSVSHHNQGSGWGPFWNETGSWSEVSLTNTGDSETTYRVLATYLADTTRFGVPWATRTMVAEATITLAPGASGVVRLDYKRDNGARGFSPRSKTCIPLAGCSPASDIGIDVLGTNDAGTYYIGRDWSEWRPVRQSLTGMSLLSATETLPPIDPPLTSYVLSAPWTQQHEAQIWINNPFTDTVPVTITQTLPPDITLLDVGGAVQNGDSLTWNTVVSPTALSVVTFTFSYPATPGTENVMPPAALDLKNPLDGQLLTTQSANEAQFQALWPLTLDYATPGYTLPGVSADVVMTATSWIDDALSGTLAITVTDAMSSTVYTEEQAFNLAAGASDAVHFTLPATLAAGDYVIHGRVTAGGASAEAFADAWQVGAPGPELDYLVTPAGEVHPGDVLTYTLRFTNTLGTPLDNAMLTASVPASVTVAANSVSDGGLVENGMVRWPLNTVPQGGMVARSFTARVNDDVAPPGSGPMHIFSEPRLTADEIAPTTGAAAWNLIVIPTSIQSITLSGGWTLLSFNRLTASAAVTEVMASVQGSYDRILGEAGTYDVTIPPSFNTLKEMQPGKAYWVHTTSSAELSILGVPQAPDTSIDLHEGWNWVGYLPEASMPVTQALASLDGLYARVIGDDGTFDASIPASFNTLKTMEPGKGYLIYMTQAATLTYPHDISTKPLLSK